MRIAILASGIGSNLKVMLEHVAAGRLSVTPVLVLSNNPQAGSLEHARAHGVPVWSKSHKGIDRLEFDREMIDEIRKAGAEAIILAGYMRILSTEFIRAFAGRILNIHPAILPSFIGVSGGKDAIDYQVRISGCTVHFVDEVLDNGPVVIQAAVPAGAGDDVDSLMQRIHAMEHRIYPQAVQWLAQGRLKVEDRKVTLLPKNGKEPALGTVAESGNGPWLVSPGLEDF